MKYKLIAFAMDFASSLIQKTKFKDEIKNVILFGSVSRSEAKPDSDIDLFIDIENERKEVENDIKKCLSDFLSSSKYNNYWKLLDVTNNIRLNIGRLKEWKELHPSIIANGITLYGKYKPLIKEGTHKTMFVWENIKPESKRVLFSKQLFGYTHGDKFYKGVIQKFGGTKLGKGVIVVPLERSDVFHVLFKKFKITVKILKFLEY